MGRTASGEVRRIAIATLLVALCPGTITSCREQTESTPAGPGNNRPNILLISVDMLRPDHLGCYGYDRPTSPNIDRLAAEGALFENAISSTSWTLPAHAALFTGLVDSVHGCTDTDRRLSENRHTLAERLREAGYATVGFFSGPYLHPVFGLGQGFDEYVDCTSYAALSTQTAEETGTVDGTKIWDASHTDITSPEVSRRVIEWLKANRRRPFFMFVHMWDVHFDFIPPPPYDRKFDPDYQGSIDGRRFLFNTTVNASMPRRDLEHVIALYDGEIAWTDEHIGQMLDEVDALGLRDSTIVVLLADHGTEFFEHGRKAHRQTLYEEVIRIPLIVRYPGRIEAGSRHAVQVGIIDVLPTITELAGLGVPDDVMGQSLAPLFSGAELRRDNLAISELFCDSRRLTPDGRWERRDPRFSMQQRLRSFRRADCKMINDLNRHRAEFFDLLADPGEQTALQSCPPTLMQDAEQARAWLKAFRKAWPAGGTQSVIPPEVLAHLKDLGYVESDEESDEREQPAP
jgi:arylsulfatase A-like enzyme